MKIEIRRMTRNFLILFAILVVMTPGVLALTVAAPPAPSYITDSSEIIDVDGNQNGWDLNNDFFAHLTCNNDDSFQELYLRYDCTNGILYAMVLLNESGEINNSASNNGEHFLKVNGSKLVDETFGDNNSAPDFQYINNTNNKIIGWEASALLATGEYALDAHTLMNMTSVGKNPDETFNVFTPLNIKCTTNDIPEFPTVILPVAAIIGLMFLFGRKRDL